MRLIFLTALFLSTTVLITSAPVNAAKTIKLKGNLVCVEVGAQGSAFTKEEFMSCDGLLFFLGTGGKLYSLHGTDKEKEKFIQSSISNTGYGELLKVKGMVGGHEREWHLYMPEYNKKREQEGTKETITGTITCILPHHNASDVRSVVSTAPCNGYEAHAHFIYTDTGRVYILHGSEERIEEIEKNANRTNISIDGKLLGNENGWILYVE